MGMISEYFTQEALEGMKNKAVWERLEIFAFGRIVHEDLQDEQCCMAAAEDDTDVPEDRGGAAETRTEDGRAEVPASGEAKEMKKISMAQFDKAVKELEKELKKDKTGLLGIRSTFITTWLRLELFGEEAEDDYCRTCILRSKDYLPE